MVTADFSPPQHHRVSVRAHARWCLVGYVVGEVPADFAGLERLVRDYAAVHRLGPVGGVYRDIGGHAPRTLRGGFDRCLHALTSGTARAVIVPRRADLAADHAERASIAAWIHAAGGAVHYIEPEGALSCR